MQGPCRTIKRPVVFTGFIPPSEIPPYYNVGDIFVCASSGMSPARIHYEAMAAGLPIITTDRAEMQKYSKTMSTAL